MSSAMKQVGQKRQRAAGASLEVEPHGAAPRPRRHARINSLLSHDAMVSRSGSLGQSTSM